MSNHEELKAAALAIGHECWVQDGSSVNTEDYRIANGEMCCDHIGCFESVNGESPHAKYVAAASPAVVLELLAALEEKDQRIAELEELATDYATKFQKAQDALKHARLLIRAETQGRQRLEEASLKVIGWCRHEAVDRTGDPNNAEFYSCVKELRSALAFVGEVK